VSPRKSDKSVLVAFCAHDGDPYPRDRMTGAYRDAEHSNAVQWGPALRLLADPRSKLYGRVSDFYYLCHPAEPVSPKRTYGRRDTDVAKDTRRELDRLLEPEQRPAFHERTWTTEAAPNDHRDLFEFLKTELRRIRAKHPQAEIVLQLSSGTSSMHAALFLAGSAGLIPGPIRLIQSERGDGALARGHQAFSEVDLTLPTVLQVARRTEPRGTIDDPAPTVDYDQAKSPALLRALAAAHSAAQVPFPVMLRGERGVGKSSFAKMIRAGSPFRKPALDQSWPSVACGQFPDATRLYVELCGARRGAYTSLNEDRKGLIALANGDTLFLDEIQDLTPACQRAIIRVVEDGRYTRLGESEWKTSRFRLITGTNLPDEPLRMRLHPDFLDRIRDLEVTVPPLRDCRDDLPWMWQATCQKVATEARLPFALVHCHTSVARRALSQQELPGNWRDLRRLAARIAAQAAQGEVSVPMMTAILEGTFAEGRESEGMPGETPVLPNRHAVNQLRKLEETFGSHCDRFWKACEAGTPPHLVLEGALGSRHKAARALAFVRRTWPTRSFVLGRLNQ
jgi:DNA-binding NtrC family response regulator